MNYISKYNSIKCTAIVAMTLEEELELRNSDEVQRSVSNPKMKQYNYYRCPNGCPMDEWTEGKRKVIYMERTNKLELDYDEHGKWEQAWDIVKDHLDEWHVIHFERSINGGAHITIQMQEGLTADEHIVLYERRTGLTLDHACTDIARAIFLVPQSYVLHDSDLYYETKLPLLPLDPDASQMLSEKQELQRQKLIEMELTPYHPQYPNDDKAEMIRICDSIVRQNIDITHDYHSWIKIAFSLYTVLGDSEGQRQFHRLSRLYPHYNHEECQQKWRNITHTSRYEVGFGTLVYLARLEGWKMS